MTGDGIDRYDFERAEKLAEWRGGVKTELKNIDRRLTEVNDGLDEYVGESKKQTAALTQLIADTNERIDKTNKRIDKNDLKAAKIAGAVSIFILFGVPLIRGWLGL
jgi:methyl-accepting chemotaxis protein